jgi:peroxiredoxin
LVDTPSTMMPLGRHAPDFSLPEPGGHTVSLSDYATAPGLLVMFICNHCPFVKHLKAALAEFGREYGERGLAIVAIASNDIEAYPQDGPEEMAREKEEWGYPFPYLFDENQEVAKAYGAACTPDFFLFDVDGRLAYRGQFDASRPSNGMAPTGSDLRGACDAVLMGRRPLEDQVPSVGCNIKWKPGNEPAYFG